jgi:outer membrane murein-binding lipoprotein Lpp
MSSMKHTRIAAGTALLALGLLAGCKSKDQKAVDQAASQATTTNTPQQVQWVDGSGNTVTKTVQPPAAAGQAPQVATTITPPQPGTHPASTDPVIMPLSAANQAPSQPMTDANGQPVAPADQQAAANGQAPPPPANGQPAPEYNLTVPAGTELAIRINQDINVKHTHAGDHFTGEIAEPVSMNGSVVLPRGTPVRGRVDESHRRGHFKGASVLELRLTSMTMNGNEYALDTHDNVSRKKGKGKRTAGFIGGMTGAGMLIGGIATGGVGLAIGGAAGAGAGTLIAGTTGNRDLNIPAESVVHFRLADPLVVQ